MVKVFVSFIRTWTWLVATLMLAHLLVLFVSKSSLSFSRNFSLSLSLSLSLSHTHTHTHTPEEQKRHRTYSEAQPDPSWLWTQFQIKSWPNCETLLSTPRWNVRCVVRLFFFFARSGWRIQWQEKPIGWDHCKPVIQMYSHVFEKLYCRWVVWSLVQVTTNRSTSRKRKLPVERELENQCQHPDSPNLLLIKWTSSTSNCRSPRDLFNPV